MAEMSREEAIWTIIRHEYCLIRNDKCNHECDKCALDVPFVKLDKALNIAIKYISQPEIIHCSECKYFTNLNDDEFALCDRAFTGMYVDADGSGFCKWAERRTDG